MGRHRPLQGLRAGQEARPVPPEAVHLRRHRRPQEPGRGSLRPREAQLGAREEGHGRKDSARVAAHPRHRAGAWRALPLDADGARLLFQVFADAYKRQSVVITTNLEFSRWESVFGGDQMAAVIDRIVHHGRLVQLAQRPFGNGHVNVPCSQILHLRYATFAITKKYSA